MNQYLIIEDRNYATFIMLGIIVNKRGTEWEFLLSHCEPKMITGSLVCSLNVLCFPLNLSRKKISS